MLNFWHNKKMAQFHCLAIFFIILDRWLKALSLNTKPDFAGWLSWHYNLNNNLALSLPLPNLATMLISAVLLMGLWFYYFQALRRPTWTAVLLFGIILGATSNLLDRWLYGGVIDYISLASLTIFNLADLLITFGLAGLVLREIFSRNHTTVGSPEAKL